MDIKYQLDYKIKQARDFQAQGKLLHSLQFYETIINDHPEFIDAYFGIAEIYELLGNINPAISLLKEYLETDPENKTARLFLGQFLLRNARWEEAIDIMSYLLPEEEITVNFFLGYARFMLRDYELARINFVKFISEAGQSELFQEANIYLAKTEIKLCNYDKALICAKRADVLYSNYWELNAIYAEIYYNLDMHAHAVSPVEKALKLNPNEPRIYELAGKIYFKLGDFIKAEKNFLKHIELTEEASSEVYAKLAEACLRGNKAKDALAYYDIALKLDPMNKYALEGKKSAASLVKNNLVNDGL
ncbi:MAG: tetratricopeptide repeat protein [Ignavibacteriaceae bacterium]|nr:tetratricopeptide repeat protein [Ignavibacteriaceae bacterium]